jgi:hypothetical protein
MTARIIQKSKNAMQSGRARTSEWRLEFPPAEPRRPDPLTGWSGSGDTRAQVHLDFPSLEAAKAYAAREGLDYVVIPTPPRQIRLQTYADNFR